MELDDPRRNALTGLGLLVLGAVLGGSLPSEITPLGVLLLALAWYKPRLGGAR